MKIPQKAPLLFLHYFQIRKNHSKAPKSHWLLSVRFLTQLCIILKPGLPPGCRGAGPECRSDSEVCRSSSINHKVKDTEDRCCPSLLISKKFICKQLLKISKPRATWGCLCFLQGAQRTHSFSSIFSVPVGSASIFQAYFKIKIKKNILHNCIGINLSNTLESWQKIICTSVIFLTIRSNSKFCVHTITAVCVSLESVEVTWTPFWICWLDQVLFCLGCSAVAQPSPQAAFQWRPPKGAQGLPAHNLLL